MDAGHYIVVQMMYFPRTEVGHIVVIVGYDPVRGFKIKSTDEQVGEVEWIPFDQMTWFQCSVTEKDLKAVRQYQWRSFDESVRNKVIDELRKWHKIATGEKLGTDFTRRTGKRLLDFGFVLKFKFSTKIFNKIFKQI